MLEVRGTTAWPESQFPTPLLGSTMCQDMAQGTAGDLFAIYSFQNGGLIGQKREISGKYMQIWGCSGVLLE